MADKVKISAVIPARAGSVRIKNKNLSEVNNTSLLARKIRQIKKSQLITEVYVGTNCEISADFAEKEGAIVVWRDDFFCNEAICSANEMIQDLTSKIESDIIVWAHCTNPFIYAEHYDAAVKAYFKGIAEGTHDSVASVYKVQSHMWSAAKRPANFNPKSPRHPLARDLEPVYFQDGGIFIQSSKRFAETAYFYGDTPNLFEIDFPHSHDINVPADLDLARLMAAVIDKDFNFFD